MAANEALQIGVIGLGSMGLGMAKSMARRGLGVRGYDVNPAAIAALAASGGFAAASAKDAAKLADVVVVVVITAAQTDAVLFGADGAAAAMQPGGVIVSCATMSPNDARALAAKAAAAGLLYLDAPMSGGTAKAASGQLTFMASGSKDAFAKARPGAGRHRRNCPRTWR